MERDVTQDIEIGDNGNGNNLSDFEMLDAHDDDKVSISDTLEFDAQDPVTDSSDTSSETEDRTSEIEDATNHLHVNQHVNQSANQSVNQSVNQSANQSANQVNQSVNQSEQAQRQFAEDSLQAHLKVVDREKYSKVPKFPWWRSGRSGFRTKVFDTGSTFTSSVRSETLKLKFDPYRLVHSPKKNPRYNETKFDKAKIVVKEELRFDPALLNLTTNSLDYYLRGALSHPPRNDGRFQLLAKRDKDYLGRLTIEFSGTSISSSVGGKSFQWRVGSTAPGGQFFEADPDEVQSLLDRLCYILQRLEPIVISNKHTRNRFLHAILNRIIRYADPAFQVKALIRSRCNVDDRRGMLRFAFFLHGFTFTPAGVDFYPASIVIKIANISSKPPKTSIQDRYTITGTDCPEDLEDLATRRALGQRHSLIHKTERLSELQGRLRDWNSTDRREQVKNALRLVEKMEYTFDGFVGPKSHLHRLAAEVRNASAQSRLSSAGSVRAMWIFLEIQIGTTLQAITPRHCVAARTALTAGTIFGLPRIYLLSKLTGRWPPVLQAILNEMVKGKGIKEYWRAGCIAADIENARIREGVAPTRVRCRCAENGPSLHPCELCLQPYECRALLRPPVELSQKRFCVFCYRRACQLLEQKKKKITSPCLLHRVRNIVRDDLTQIYGTTGYQAPRDLLEFRVNGIWDELQGQALEEEGIPYAWKDSYAADICGDSAQANIGSVREVWLGHIVSPFTASPDGVFQVALDADRNVGYHVPGNISITSQAFNFFLDRYPPICLPLTERSRLAESRADLDNVSKAFCNLVTTMNSIPKLKKDRCKWVLREPQMAELHTALRTAQPGPEPRQYSGWHAPGDGPGIGRTHHLRTVEEAHIIYQYTQLHDIRKLPKYQPIIQDDPEFCFKKGVFFPFSVSAPVEYWYEHNNQAFFNYQLTTKDRVCDRATKYHHTTNTSLMMFQTYRNCLDMALKNGKKKDGSWTIQDELGLEPWPLLDMPWTGSIGHIIHGEPMVTGYPPGVPYPENQEDYDEKRNNMAWETWGWNHEKRSMGDEPELMEKMLARHRNLRPAAEVKRFWELGETMEVDPDYIDKITNARKQWRPSEKKHSQNEQGGESCKDSVEPMELVEPEQSHVPEDSEEPGEEPETPYSERDASERNASTTDAFKTDAPGLPRNASKRDASGGASENRRDACKRNASKSYASKSKASNSNSDASDDEDWNIPVGEGAIPTWEATAETPLEDTDVDGKEMFEIYRCLETIRTTASPTLVEVIQSGRDMPKQEQKQRQKRRRRGRQDQEDENTDTPRIEVSRSERAQIPTQGRTPRQRKRRQDQEDEDTDSDSDNKRQMAKRRRLDIDSDSDDEKQIGTKRGRTPSRLVRKSIERHRERSRLAREQLLTAAQRHNEEAEQKYPGITKAMKDKDTGKIAKLISGTAHVTL